MKYKVGPVPVGKAKPKSSPLDTDPGVAAVIRMVTSNSMQPGEYARVEFNHETEKQRLGVKYPWRMVRDRFNRFLAQANLDKEYHTIAKQIQDGVWAVGIVYAPPEMEQTVKAATPKQLRKRREA